MEYKKYTAKTVNEAITNASVDLEVPSNRLEYEVIQEPSNGFLGIGSKPAIIQARVKEEKKPETVKEPEKKAEPAKTKEEPEKKAESVSSEEENVKILTNDVIEQRAAAAAAKTQNESAPDSEEFSSKREKNGGRRRYDRDSRRPYDKRRHETAAVKHEPSRPKPERVVTPKSEEEVAELTTKATEFLSSVFAAMNLDVKMDTSYDQKEGSLNVVFSGEEMGILIGKRGQTLDSLQYLTSLVVNKGKNEYTRIKLDTEDYRGRREETLNNLARNIAFKVRKTHRPVSLEPMNPYERRIIHSALQNNKFVETYSEGEEPYRHVVVAPKR